MNDFEIIKSEIKSSFLGCDIARGAHLLVAVSGGIDSMVLLRALCALAEEFDLKLSAVHLDHMYRGDAAIADANLVKRYCRSLGVKCHVYRRPVGRLAAATGCGFEAAARQLRYRLFSALKYAIAADYIVTAHHRDDLAESVLMHIIRGSGIDGLIGIEGLGGDLYRPLLAVSKETLSKAAETLKIPYNHDVSNDDASFFRNRVRHHLMPQLARDYNRSVVDHLAQLSSIVGLERDYLKTDTARFYREVFDAARGALSIARYCGAHEARRRRLIRHLFAVLGGSVVDLTFKHVAQLDQWILKGAVNSQQMLHGLYFFKDRAFVRITSNPVQPVKRAASALQLGENELPAYGLKVHISETPLSGKVSNCSHLCIPAEQLAELVVRTRQAGDFMRLKGMHGRSKSLKKILNEAAIAIETRAQLPLLASGSEIFWGLGLRPSQYCAVPIDSNQKLIYIYVICCD